MPSTTANTPSSLKSLFKDWIRLSSNEKNVRSEFNHYELIEREDDWFEISDEASISAEHKHLQTYAAGEFLAHGLVYRKDLPETSVQTVLEEDGTYREYQCTRLKTNHDGLVGFILVPTSVNTDKTPDIKVIFRGTDPSSAASLKRDLELRGAGSISFAANRDSILKQINQAVATFNQEQNINHLPVSITFGGHSLGGADAQNALNATLQAICDAHGLSNNSSNNHEQLATVNKLKMFTYNAAGVPKFTAKQCEANATLLATQRAKDGSPLVSIECYNQRVGGDGVQQTGEAHVLNNVPATVAKVDVLKAHIGCEHRNPVSLPAALATMSVGVVAGGVPGFALATAAVTTAGTIGLKDTATAHTKHLYQDPIQATYERMSNATPDGQKQVHSELNKKSWWLNALHKGAGMLFGFEKHKNAAKMEETATKSTVQSKPAVEEPKAHRTLLQRVFSRKVAAA